MPTSLRETLLCRYHYDPLDRLIDSTLFDQSAIQRFYCKSRLATEVQDAVQHSFFQYGEQLLAQHRHLSTRVEASLLATDQQRSVLNSLDTTRTHPFVYTPYGYRSVGGDFLSLLGYNGERPDSVTGHYHLGNGYRQYNPVLKRFNSPDSWSPFGDGGLNAYGYCGGNPPNLIDPSGRVSLLAMKTYLLAGLSKPYKSLTMKIQQEFGEMLSSYKRAQPPLTATEMVARRRLSAPSLVQFDKAKNPEFAKTLISIHGTDIKHHSSLISGLDLDRRVPTYGNTEGSGFYSSPFHKTAERYSTPHKGGAVGVYTINPEALKRGRDIDFSAIEGSGCPNYIQVIIRANAYSRVHIKPLGAEYRVSMPRSHEAPF